MIIKFLWVIKSFFLTLILRIRYRGKVCSNAINFIQGKLNISIKKNGRIFIGKYLMTREPCYLQCGNQGEIIIGEKVFFNHNVSITANQSIKIGNNVCIANNVVIVDHDHIVTPKGVMNELSCSPVVIGNSVWIGANVTVTKGVSIGEGAVVAAGAVVTHSIPPHEVWGGIPAKKIRSISTTINE